MKLAMKLTASLIAACSLALTVQAAPPEGKGPGNHLKSSSNKGRGGPDMHNNRGNSDKGNPNKTVKRDKGPSAKHDDSRFYDDRGRHKDYYDERRRHTRDGNLLGNLVYAGITAALARDYAQSYGLRGHTVLPPGIRKNLARGKPLPPGIGKKIVSSSLLGRLPRHEGYEWRIAGTDLVLISMATAVVADVLYDVFD